MTSAHGSCFEAADCREQEGKESQQRAQLKATTDDGVKGAFVQLSTTLSLQRFSASNSVCTRIPFREPVCLEQEGKESQRAENKRVGCEKGQEGLTTTTASSQPRVSEETIATHEVL